MSPGMKSSEFVLSLVPMLVGLLLIALGAFKGNQQALETGMWLILGGSGSYGLSRGLAKFGGGVVQPAPAESAPANAEAAAKVISEVK